MKTISPHELLEKKKQDGSLDLIDVRTPVEFREVHVDFAKNVPLDKLDPADYLKSKNGDASNPIFVICKTGARGQKACEKFIAAGHENVFNVEGGTNACVESNVPVTRGKKAVSLERQVRIVAGALVVLGAALGFFVHEAFYGLSAFIGAGLVFAGVTDTCAMGMLIAKMPWNQVKSCPVESGANGASDLETSRSS